MTKIIKLEQNYRSTKSILDAANAVIKHNEKKYEKNLWTEQEGGKLPTVARLDNEYEEANFIVEQINRLKREEYYKYSDFTVLYRMNAQSRSIEDIFRRENVPYKMIGGLKFYERKEIKDAIAYLRLIHNQADNLSLQRVINEPKRGIGQTSMEKIEAIAEANNISMYAVIKNAEKYGLNKVYLNSREFINTIEELSSKKEETLISELLKEVLNKTGYTKALELENTAQAESRIENLNEFLTVAMEFEEENAENSIVQKKIVKVANKAEADWVFNYPYAALEEALANAVYHKGYDVREPIEVRVEKEMIEIVSFPGPDRSVTQEGLNRYKVSNRRYRNRRIGDILKELHLTEGRNTGFGKILRALEENGSPKPEFETDDEHSYFISRIFVHESFLKEEESAPNQKGAKKEPKRSQKGAENKLEILEKLKDNPEATQVKLMKEFNLSRKQIQRIFNDLQEEGLVERQGPNNGGRWIVK